MFNSLPVLFIFKDVCEASTAILLLGPPGIQLLGIDMAVCLFLLDVELVVGVRTASSTL